MKFVTSLILVALFGASFVSSLPRNDEALSRDNTGAKLFRVEVKTEEVLKELVRLQQTSFLDFWTEPRALGHVDIMARRPDLPMFESFLEKYDLDFEVTVEDVSVLLHEREQAHQEARAKSGSNAKMDWVSYHTLEEIYAWMDQLVVDHPDVASISNVGVSFEFRQMKMLKLSTGGTGKQAIFTDGGIHAREWISPATVNYFIDQLLTNSADLLASVDFYFMPSINPDGYSYTFTDDRMWRKTRSVNPGSVCNGADPNRNWDFHWMEGGASDSPCSDVYAGSKPFSEAEMRNVRDVLLDIQPRVYLTFHSYSQLWMYPWGYTADLPVNWKDLDNLAQDAVTALTAVHGTKYQIGSSTNTIYIAAGGSDDWAMGVGGSEYAYTIELRDTGRYGFLLPEYLIIPTAEETWEGFKVVAQFVATLAKE